ncbi:MAG: hypothetical protein ACI841_004281 [Planctomycetota bacterium]|jgi:hypothetical protein
MAQLSNRKGRAARTVTEERRRRSGLRVRPLERFGLMEAMAEARSTQDSRLKRVQASGLGLLLIAILIGFLRYWKLGEWSLWHDEAITWADAHHAVGTGQLYNPLGYVAIRWTVAFLGGIPTEFALRLLPALCGHLAVLLTWWAFRPILGGRRAALAALLVAVSSWQIYWSQNARFYTMAEVLGLLGGGLVLRAYWSGSSTRAVLGALCLALGAWIQLSCALLLGALIASPILAKWVGAPIPEAGRRLSRRTWMVAIVLGLASAPWAVGIWSTYVDSKGSSGGLVARLSGASHFLLTTGYFVTPLLGVGFLLGFVRAWLARDAGAVLIALVAILGCAAGVAASLGAVVSAQYVFVLSPWIAAGAASLLPADSWPSSAGGSATAGTGRGPGWVLIALLVLPAAADSLLYFTQRFGGRERWREAWHYVWEEQREGDLVAGMAAPVGEYYLAPGRTDLRHPRSVAWIDKHRAGLGDRWSSYPRRVWYVIRPDSLATWEAADRDAFRARLQEECRIMRRFPVTMEGRDLDVEVWLYEPQ